MRKKKPSQKLEAVFYVFFNLKVLLFYIYDLKTAIYKFKTLQSVSNCKKNIKVSHLKRKTFNQLKTNYCISSKTILNI